MLCFNRRLGCLHDKPVINITLLEDLFDAIDRDLKSIGIKPYRFFNTPLYRKFKKGADHIHSICQTEIKSALKKLETAERDGNLEEYLQEPNLLYSLLSHPKMTPRAVDRTLLDLFIGGVESTSNTLIYVPTSPGMYRCFDNDVVVGGYHIPAGTEIVVCLLGMCEDPHFFKSPEIFLPERFVRDDNTLTEEYKYTNPFAILPFGFGPRSCIGQRFAETEIHILTAKIFQRLEASLPPGTDSVMEYKYRTFATPKHAVPLMLSPRKN
ncbi:probable cytochrome P450 49a1 [Saccostrea cucullata]|uniref:probable cytochrome P450 49a1 n=1 Tax=Saccostrea cuccullata TaxID=36930 RepID=UPI002ED5EC20